MKNSSEEKFYIDTIISEGTIINGDLNAHNNLRIDGIIKGNIYNSNQVLIGESGFVEGEIFANNVIIGGKVIGNVAGLKCIEILTSSNINVNIFAPKLIIEEGTLFKGYCYIHQSFLNQDFNSFIEEIKNKIENLKETNQNEEREEIMTK